MVRKHKKTTQTRRGGEGRERSSFFPKNAWLIDSQLYLKCSMSYGKLTGHKTIEFTIDNNS
jgi:hypothetical protein